MVARYTPSTSAEQQQKPSMPTEAEASAGLALAAVVDDGDDTSAGVPSPARDIPEQQPKGNGTKILLIISC